MDKIRNPFKNISILVSFMLFLLPSVILAVVITIGYATEFGGLSNEIKYSYNTVDMNGNPIYSPDELITLLSPKDKFLYYLFEFLSVAMWIIPTLLVVTLVPYVFYKLKIKKPLDLLLESADKIANEDVNFVIDYKAKDELGQLSAAFEKMRSSLEENNKETWRKVEERKKLNAIFAHDLRTPLTVLRGYSEFLMKYVPENKLSQEKLLQTIETMNHHILRIEHYVEHMNDIQTFDDTIVQYGKKSFLSLAEKLQENIQMMSPQQIIDFQILGNNRDIEVDENMIYQVFENIISNAMVYAQHKIQIQFKLEGNIFLFNVSDDGVGFSKEDLPYLTQAFYRSEKDFNKKHFGLGLYTCRKLCEKHGGELLIENNKIGGASITASFLAKS